MSYIRSNYAFAKLLIMKKIVGLFVLVVFVLSSCGPKPYYKTAKGKKKQKYYNDIQFGGKSASQMKGPY